MAIINKKIIDAKYIWSSSRRLVNVNNNKTNNKFTIRKTHKNNNNNKIKTLATVHIWSSMGKLARFMGQVALMVSRMLRNTCKTCLGGSS